MGRLDAYVYTPEAKRLIEFVGKRVVAEGWRVLSAHESSYRLVLGLAKNVSERISLEVNFDKQGLASSIRPLLCGDPSFVENIRRLLE